MHWANGAPQSLFEAHSIELPQLLSLRQCWPLWHCESFVQATQVRSLERQYGADGLPAQSPSTEQDSPTGRQLLVFTSQTCEPSVEQ